MAAAGLRAAHATLLRPTLVYGAGRDATLTRIATLARRWGRFPLPRHANGLRQPVHVDDLAMAAFAALGSAASHGQTYALPGGETVTYREMVRRVLAVLEPPPTLVELPSPLFNLALAAAKLAGGTGLGEAAVQRMRAVLGVLLLSTRGGDIDNIVAAERWGIVRVSLFAAAVTVVLSMILANTIAGPVQRLSAAAERVRHSVKARAEIPDFTDRTDEIGHLSGALRDMTQALYKRIDAIESFAADVAHELKNPLTSLRSATETLPLAKTDDSKERLMEIIQHDVKRLDRLISDISDASRLDAELAREDARPVDTAELLRTTVSLFNDIHRDDTPEVVLDIAYAPGAHPYRVTGHDSRLSQVIVNLLENAISFSPPEGRVAVLTRRVGGEVQIVVEDEGPGIPSENLERIFERFYTDRPQENFGQNSGLGLNISRQIVVAHGGRLYAENRPPRGWLAVPRTAAAAESHGFLAPRSQDGLRGGEVPERRRKKPEANSNMPRPNGRAAMAARRR